MNQLMLPFLESDEQTTRSNSLLLSFAQNYTGITEWGKNWKLRDRQLRHFYKTEPILLSAIHTIAETRSALGWSLDGTPAKLKYVEKIFRNSESGQGWYILIKKVLIDVLTQDNGGFIKINRKSNKPTAFVLSLEHLSSDLCERTGNPKQPVNYLDPKTKKIKKLKWYEVMTFEDMPSPEYQHLGRQICFVSRVLKAAQVIRSIQQYKEEKVTGNFTKQIHIVSGVAQSEIEDAEERANIDKQNLGFSTYSPSVILASLDPNSKVDHVKIDLATLPDDYDEDQTFKWYIAILAMGAAGEYQDFAPLPGTGLGSSEQSDVLHLKAQTKGNAGWMKLVEHKLRYHNVIPKQVRFSYQQQDARAELDQAVLEKTRVDTIKTLGELGTIDSVIARQLLVDFGYLKPEYLDYYGELDTTPTIRLTDDESIITDPARIKSFEPIPLELRLAVGRRFKSLYLQSPIELSNTTNEYKLEALIESIVYSIRGTTVIEIKDWIDDLLSQACEESGISPLSLKQRFVEGYKIEITPSLIKDNLGWSRAITQVKEKNKSYLNIQKYKSLYTTPTFSAMKGWTTENLIGFKGYKSEFQPDFGESCVLFKQQLEHNVHQLEIKELYLFLASCYTYSYMLGSDKEFDETAKYDIIVYLNQVKGILEDVTPTLAIPLFIKEFTSVYEKGKSRK